jgi:acetolactate synthase-1/2/3 large subunit
MEVADRLVGAMARRGISNLWFTSGTELAFYQEACLKAKAEGRPTPTLRTCPHEHVALAAAGGETRVTGRPSATAAHVDVGLINAGGAVHNAFRGGYPVLMTSGCAPSAPPGSRRGARDSAIQWLQQLPDQSQIVRPYMKWDHRMNAWDDPDLIMGRAVQVMMSEPKGPAYLALAREIMMQEAATASPPVPLSPAALGAPDPAALSEIADALANSQMPAIITDRPPAAACEHLLALAELLGAPVGRGGTLFSIPDDHPLARGPANEFALQAGTDMVLAVDVAVPWLKGPRPRMAAIGVDPTFEGTPLYEFPCDWALRCRSDIALAQLVEAIDRRLTPAGRERCRARREALSVKRQPASTLREAAQEALARSLGPDAVIFHEMAEPERLLRRRPGTLFGNGGSAIGWAAAAAVGAKVARPDLQVAAVCGDGSWHFANPVATLWTAAYHHAPVLIIVLNNGGYRTGTLTVAHDYPEGQAVRAHDFEGGWLAPSPDFAAIARACGCFGATVEGIASLESALRQALAAGVPAVVDIRLPQIGR